MTFPSDQQLTKLREKRLQNWLCPTCGSPLINANLKNCQSAVCSNLVHCNERLRGTPLPKDWVSRNHALAAGIQECRLFGDAYQIEGSDGKFKKCKKVNRKDYHPEFVRSLEVHGKRLAVDGRDVVLLEPML